MTHGYTKRAAAAWGRFQAAVAAQGGTVVEERWNGAHTPHRVRCVVGHDCTPKPVNVARQGICLKCWQGRSDVAWDRFRAAVAAQGGTVLEGRWLGDHSPHRVRCAVGHEVAPYPNSVKQGTGICRVCAGKTWDAFYVVRHPSAGVVKFGITSGDPRPRLGDHAGEGFTERVRLSTSLPGTTALDLERELKAVLRAAGVRPVRGCEYFPDAAMNVLLAVVDGWLAASEQLAD